MERCQPFLEEFASGMERIYHDREFSDVTIEVGGKQFYCHRVVLSAMSPYFHSMFCSGMRESHEQVIKLPFLDRATFERLLEVFYSCKDIVMDSNVETLLHAASFLQMDCLHSRCEEVLSGQLSKNNCIDMWQLARKHQSKILEQRAWMYMQTNFPEVAKSETFVLLDPGDLASIIQADGLVAPNEETVCDAVLRWIKRDLENRKMHLATLFEVIRLPLTSSEYLWNLTERNAFLKDNEDVDNYLKEARKFHMLPARRHQFTSKRTEPRICSEFEDVLVVLGGIVDLEDNRTPSVNCYSFQQKKWFRLSSMPYDPGTEFACCNYGQSNIYVTGGSYDFRGMLKYNAHTNKWTISHLMNEGRRRHVMTAVGNALYVIGGYDDYDMDNVQVLSSVEKFNLMSNKWSKVGELILAVASMSSAVVDERIFIFGGCDPLDEQTQMVQCFDTRSATTTHILDLPEAEYLTQTVGFDDYIYIITMYGEVFELMREKDFEFLGDVWNKDDNEDIAGSGGSGEEAAHNDDSSKSKALFGAVQHRDSILVMGGISNDSMLTDEIHSYNINTSDAELLPVKLVRPLSAFGCLKAVVKKKHFKPLSATDD